MLNHKPVRVYMLVILISFTLLMSCQGGTGQSNGNGSGSGSQPPVAPAFSGTPVSGNGNVTVFWNAIAGATSYTVYVASDPTVNKINYISLQDGRKVPNITAGNCKVTGLVNDKTYYFVVTAFNGAGESDDSAVVSASPTFLSAPAGVLASAGDGQVAIRWNIVAGATQYAVYSASQVGITTDNCQTLTDCAGFTVNGNTSHFTQTALTNGKTYYFIVTALTLTTTTKVIQSDDSSEVSATPQQGATNLITLTANAVTDASSTVSGVFDNPVGYTTTVWFEYGTTPAYGITTTPSIYAVRGEFTVSADIIGLQQTSTYHYRMVAQNSAGTFNGNDQTFTTLVTPQILASGLSGPRDIAVDASSVYWTECTSGTVNKMGINGGPIFILASVGTASCPSHIALDDTSVYWTEYGGGAVKKVDKAGVAITTLASGLHAPLDIAVDALNAYWVEWGGGSVRKVNKTGGAVTDLVTGLVSPIALAVDDASVYFAESIGTFIKKIDKNGGAITNIGLETSGSFYDIAVDSTAVYYAYGSSVRKVGSGGGTATTLAVGGGYQPPDYENDIAVDATNVYFSGGPGIQKVPVNGGAVAPLVVGNDAYGIAMDLNNIYFIEYIGGNLKKIAK